MSITGSGTRADPYVVTTWDELASKVSETGVYIKIGNDIDLNNEYPEGLTSGLTINCASIDGDGKTIKNLYFKSGRLFYCEGNRTWENTNIINFVLGDGNNGAAFHYNSTVYNTLTFKQCKLSGRLNSGLNDNNRVILASGRLKFNRCSLNIYFSENTSTLSNSPDWRDVVTFLYCNVNFTGVTNKGLNMLLDNSYIKGSLPSATISTTSSQGTKSVYSVLDIETTECTGSSGTNLVLCNSDKITTISENLTSVTTSQLTNATYLSGIGFPIQT
jgi:hypothetical protein